MDIKNKSKPSLVTRILAVVVAVLLGVSPATALADAGVDVSNWQGCVNSAALKADGADFLIVKVTEGNGYTDPVGDCNIQAAIEKLRAGKTIISIAHRLSTLRDADLLAVIDDGRLCESGTHRELLERRGVYFNLHKIQLDSLKFINQE